MHADRNFSERLRWIERAEQAVRSLGFRVCRVRHHDATARVEIGRSELDRALSADVADRIAELVRAGFADGRLPEIGDGEPAILATTLAAAKEQGAIFAYGSFITVFINFLIVAFVLFQLVKISNRMRKAEPAPPPPGPSTSEKLLAEIRDALVKKK